MTDVENEIQNLNFAIDTLCGLYGTVSILETRGLDIAIKYLDERVTELSQSNLAKLK